MRKSIILILFFTVPAFSQITLDSAQVAKLIIKLNKLDELIVSDSLNEAKITRQDTLIKSLERENGYYSQANFNLEEINYNLKKKITELEAEKVKWYWYAGGGGLILVIGVLTGLLIK